MSGSGSNKSLYDVLGVTKSDSCTAIKKAYLRLARVHHPDKGGDPEKFKEITHASDVLTDEKRRKMYDEFGVTDEQQMQGMPQGMPGMPPGFSFPFEFNMNDLFGNMFGNPPVGQRGQVRKGRKPAPTVQTIGITLEQFYIGHNFDINSNRQAFCTTCDHTGAKNKETCKKCNGQGAVTQVVQMGPMAMHTTGPCLDCQGKGERILEVCKKCTNGFTSQQQMLPVRIAPGTKTNEVYIFPEVCSDHPAFERPGDAHIIIGEDPNDPAFKAFKRVGDQMQDLETHVTLSLGESLIGCTIRIDLHPGYDEGLFIKIPACALQNDKYCLTGFGMPLSGNIGKYGDLFIYIDVNVSEEERVLFVSKTRDDIAPLFEDRVRKTVCPEDAVQTDVRLRCTF
jgi:DnaJ family protein A protein 2